MTSGKNKARIEKYAAAQSIILYSPCKRPGHPRRSARFVQIHEFQSALVDGGSGLDKVMAGRRQRRGETDSSDCEGEK